MKGSRRSRFFYFLYLAILFLPCLEIALLIAGYRPFRNIEFSIQSEPELCLIPHPKLGFALQPGTFEVSINKGQHYTTTHGTDSLRIGSLQPRADSLPSIFVMGCSYTYGMGIDDSLAMAYLLQQKLPNHRIKSFAVPAYGTIQSFLQLKAELDKGAKPELVIVNYSSLHDDRNVLAPSFRRDLFLGYQQANEQIKSLMSSSRIPYLEKGKNGTYKLQWCKWEELYKHRKGRETFATVNFLQDFSDKYQAHFLDSKEATVYLFKEIRSLCREYEIPLLVTCLTSTPSAKKTLELLREEGFDPLDMSLDLLSPEYHNAPFDSHPNARAHRHFAEEVYTWLVTEDYFPE